MRSKSVSTDPGAVEMNRTSKTVTVLPKDRYLSEAVAAAEKERLWPRVWQMACRVEELKAVGDYVTFDVGDESIIVVRSAEDAFRAFYNVCQHRGRRLVDGCGQATQFTCRFHGWSYGLDGENRFILDQDDWEGHLAKADVGLKEVQLDTWGGFVFINMDPDSPPLGEYLSPMPSFLDPFEMPKMRYRWSVGFRLDCNWKVALEAFNETYHVNTTHPQTIAYVDYHTMSRVYGDHGMFVRSNVSRGARALTADRQQIDVRQSIVEYMRILAHETQAMIRETDLSATTRILTEVEPGASADEVMARSLEFQKEAALANGSGWPAISNEQLREAGIGWHVFPNMILLPFPGGVLGYRSRPSRDDPEVCIFEIFALQRYAPGAEPNVKKRMFNNWREYEAMPPLLAQDFENIPEVQRGMRSRGFNGSVINPVRETVIQNFHRAIDAYLREEE